MPEENEINEIQMLEARINKAKQNNEPFDKYILQEIDWLKRQLSRFLKQMQESGRDINTDIDVAEIEVKQYAVMKQLAQQIGAPTVEYDAKIKEIQCRLFGEENWENLFGSYKKSS